MTSMLVPTLRLSEPGLVDWLAGVLGLEVTERTPTDDGGLAHAQLWLGDAQLLMASTTGMVELPTGVASLYLAFDDESEVRRRFARAEAAGATVVMAPTAMDYGGINATFRDPDGNLWSLGTYLPARS
ncbi:MAG: VOC family protein [Patulibacter minatonensis]